MLVTAAGLGYVEGTETRTATPSGLRIGGFTPSQVIGLGAAAVEVWSDDRDTKLIASGVSNGGLSISAYKMGYERGMQGGSPPTT